MASRIELHNILCHLLGSNNVYFQPPNNIEMNYPAIVYSLGDINNKFADNSVHIQTIAYEVTVIDEDPDSEIVKKVSLLPSCKFNRHYTADNLNHYVFKLYY